MKGGNILEDLFFSRIVSFFTSGKHRAFLRAVVIYLAEEVLCQKDCWRRIVSQDVADKPRWLGHVDDNTP